MFSTMQSNEPYKVLFNTLGPDVQSRVRLTQRQYLIEFYSEMIRIPVIFCPTFLLWLLSNGHWELTVKTLLTERNRDFG